MDDAPPLIRQETMEPGILWNPWIQRQKLAPVINIYGEFHLVVNLADNPFPLLRFRRDHDHEIKRGAFLRPAIEVGIDGQMPIGSLGERSYRLLAPDSTVIANASGTLAEAAYEAFYGEEGEGQLKRN